jgi:hypothetical protein
MSWSEELVAVGACFVTGEVLCMSVMEMGAAEGLELQHTMWPME